MAESLFEDGVCAGIEQLHARLNIGTGIDISLFTVIMNAGSGMGGNGGKWKAKLEGEAKRYTPDVDKTAEDMTVSCGTLREVINVIIILVAVVKAPHGVTTRRAGTKDQLPTSPARSLEANSFEGWARRGRDMNDERHVNQMTVHSKAVTTSDERAQGKRIQAEKKEKERYLDAVMRIERLEARKLFAGLEEERLHDQRRGVYVISERVEGKSVSVHHPGMDMKEAKNLGIVMGPTEKADWRSRRPCVPLRRVGEGPAALLVRLASRNVTMEEAARPEGLCVMAQRRRDLARIVTPMQVPPVPWTAAMTAAVRARTTRQGRPLATAGEPELAAAVPSMEEARPVKKKRRIAAVLINLPIQSLEEVIFKTKCHSYAMFTV
jgi:hypothetical protein